MKIQEPRFRVYNLYLHKPPIRLKTKTKEYIIFSAHLNRGERICLIH